MGLMNLLSETGGTINNGLDHIDPEEHFAIPLKRVEEDRVGLHRDLLKLKKNLSLMVLGQPGSGKTSTITFLAKQMQADHDEPVVIFDYKGDYGEKGIYDPDTAIILALDGSTEIWNVFEEGNGIRDYQTIAEALFQEENDQSENKFFTEGSQDLFMACLYYIDNSPSYPNPTNEDLLEFIYPQGPQDVPVDRIRNELLQSNSRQVKAAASELDPNSPETATNMYQTLRKRVARVFDGDFAKQGEFSIREYMENPQGRTLVLDMSGPEQDVMAPMFRIFLDWSIKLGLNDRDRYTYYILDEFDEVGELQQIQRLLSTGRAQLTEAVIGVQSRAQLQGVYGESGAETILQNCPQKLLMRMPDDKEYVREQVGKEKYEIEQTGYAAQTGSLGGPLLGIISMLQDQKQIQENERYPIEEQDITRFDRGEGIFITQDGWVWGRFPLWEELSEETRAHLTGETVSEQPSSDQNQGRDPNRSKGILDFVRDRFVDQSPITLIIGSETISVPVGKPIGEEIRDAYIETGGDETDAGYVHREHFRFDFENGCYAVVSLGKNETKVGDTVVRSNERVQVEDGDRLKLADRISVIVRIED